MSAGLSPSFLERRPYILACPLTSAFARGWSRCTIPVGAAKGSKDFSESHAVGPFTPSSGGWRVVGAKGRIV